MTCYVDSTIALPLLTAYSLSRQQSRKLKRLMDRMPELMQNLTAAYDFKRLKEESSV